MGTYSNKQTSGKKWLTYLHRERERYTHAGTQQHRRMRRRPIQSIFHHKNVILRCRDDSSGWNSFRQIRIHSKKQAERSDRFTSIETDKHRRTEQHSRTRRRPIPNIFDHQYVGPRCRDDSSGWNSFFFFFPFRHGIFLDEYTYTFQQTSRKKWLILLKALVCFVLLKTRKIIHWLYLQLLGLNSGCLGVFFFFFSPSILWS